jgi:uncharacterized protein (DUF885 family)
VIDYLYENNPATMDSCEIAADRYIVMPGQATAYMIGKQKILKLRSEAEKALGDDFKLRQFHELILTRGAQPLDPLEDVVDEWIKSK